MTFITNPASVTNSTGNSTTTNVGGITTLNNGGVLTAGATSMTVTDGTVFANGQSIKIESEYIIIGTVTVNVLSGCTRGAFNSTAASHADSSTVTGVYIGSSEVNSQPDVTMSILTDVDGKVYFDLSDDNVTWSSNPSSGYTITANQNLSFNEIKAKRYFRSRFETESTSPSTNFNLYTYYGVFRQKQHSLNSNLAVDEQTSIVRSVLTAKNSQNSYSNITTSYNGSIDVSLLNPVSSFGDMMTSKLTPNIQNQFTYYDGGQITNTNLFDIFTSDYGMGYGDDGQLNLFADPYNQNLFTIYQSKALNKYRPGEGSRVKISFLFSPQRLGTIQTIGMGSSSNGLFLVQEDTVTKVVRKYGGRNETRKLEITSGVSSDGTLRIILNGKRNYIELLNGDNISVIARKIVESPLHPWEELGWTVKKDIASVYFTAIDDGELTGTFSAVSGGAGFAATFTTVVVGKSSYTETIPQSSWDDKCDGTRNLPIVDFTKGNVLKISYQWLGYGQMSFDIINKNTGFFNTFHKIRYSNSENVPSLENPDGPVFLESKNKLSEISISFDASADVDSGADTISVTPTGDFKEELFVTYSHFGNSSIGIPENYSITFDGTSGTDVIFNSDTLYLPNHGFKQGEEVRYSDGGGSEVIGITDNTIYYIIRKGKNHCQLADSYANSQNYIHVFLDGPGTGTTHTLTSKRAYVKVSSPNVFQFSALPGGSAINLTATSGTQSIVNVISNSSSITVDGSNGSVVTGNTIVKSSHGFFENESIFYEDYSGTGSISGLTTLTHYYAKNVTTNSFSLASTRNNNIITLAVGTGAEHRFTSIPTVSTACNCGFSEGENIIIGQKYSVNGRQQTTATSNEYPLLLIFNKPHFNSRKNRIVIKIKDVSFGYSKVNAADKEATAEFRLYINSNIVSTTNSFNDIDSFNSPVSYSTLTASDTITGGKRVDTIFTSIGGSYREINLTLFPGDNFIITGRDPSNTGIILNSSCSWVEDI